MNNMLEKKSDRSGAGLISGSPLGKKSAYITQYSPELLFPISRAGNRSEINISHQLPFYGFDTWNVYELSWLNSKGQPVVALLQLDIVCSSKIIIESKSLKLYLNSLNQTQFDSMQTVKETLEKDLTLAAEGVLSVTLFRPNELLGTKIEQYEGEYLDDYDVTCDTYTITPEYLSCIPGEIITETIFSDLLKSNCPITNQPDWGSIKINYTGKSINKAGMLKYIVSFRGHNEFHEHCVERIFMDIMKHCSPSTLTVEARYTRRGGLEINPIRSTEKIRPAPNIRMARQ